MDPEQLGRPIFESSCVEGPTSHVGKALPLREIQLALLKRILGALAIFDVREGSIPSDNLSDADLEGGHRAPETIDIPRQWREGTAPRLRKVGRQQPRCATSRYCALDLRDGSHSANLIPELCSTESPVYSVQRLFTNVQEPLDNVVKVIAGIVSTTSRKRSS